MINEAETRCKRLKHEARMESHNSYRLSDSENYQNNCGQKFYKPVLKGQLIWNYFIVTALQMIIYSAYFMVVLHQRPTVKTKSILAQSPVH